MNTFDVLYIEDHPDWHEFLDMDLTREGLTSRGYATLTDFVAGLVVFCKKRSSGFG